MKSAFGVRQPGVVTEIKRLDDALGCNMSHKVKEQERALCHECKEKGVLSSACRDCNGRGRAVMKVETEMLGVPVMSDCKRCCGKGYERIPAVDAYRADLHQL